MTKGPFDGRHVLVTGGTRGIGVAIARKMVAEGGVVTILGRNAVRAETMAREIGAAGFAAADVTDRAGLIAAIREAEERHGGVAVLVNNAGAAESAPFLKTPPEQFARMLSINLESVITACHAVLPGMIAAKGGRIINIASTAGLKGYRYVSAYVTAKHAVVGLTRSLALETAETGITVNAVCPGFADTDLVRESIARIREKTGRDEAEIIAEMVRDNPQKRLIDPAEVADCVAWLAGDGAGAVTGQSIAVAGGEVM
ncbi:SDR family NAD(P)-dependent oxidoreductase [Stappia indica]|uniref:SDR family NAD(P)-dependent oxidoreductase n=1 Tax=Stappia indica TaxID=538381 RepID=UPI001CD2C59F|nr:SDR family NAD(P)-dependent oxidoreductase [Stappia indica]MCA1298397.1 SDR family oxidoreductase [Stappia indica]